MVEPLADWTVEVEAHSEVVHQGKHQRGGWW